MLATGEESIALYDALRTARLYSSVWYETGAGAPNPVLLPRITFFYFIGTLQFFHIPVWILQFAIFLVSNVIASLSVYFLMKHILQKIYTSQATIIAMIAAIFYLFNPYVMTQVWARFLYTQFFAFALLPLGLLLFYRYIETSNIRYAVWFIVSSLGLSIAFGIPSFIIDFWFVLCVCSLSLFFLAKTREEKIHIVSSSLLLLLFWLVTNIWYLYSAIHLGSNAFSANENIKTNLASAQGVSEYFPLDYVIRLIHQSALIENPRYGTVYQSLLFMMISWMIPLLSIIGALHVKKTKIIAIFIVLSIVGIIISAGTNPPFGSLFTWLFLHVPDFQLFRNPYEKFGLVLVLGLTPLFALGLYLVATKITHIIHEKNVLYIIIGVVLCLVCVVYAWPMWTGKVMFKKQVIVPSYYKRANDWLNQQHNDYRVLQMPLSPGDGAVYAWEKGYDGNEPSEFLFDRESVSKILRTSYFDDTYLHLVADFSENKNVINDFSQLNIGYIVLHDDLSPQLSWNKVQQTKQIIDANKNIHLVKTFGKLTIYKINNVPSPGLFVTNHEMNPKISYKKIGATHYLISVSHANKPFELIFKETYNSSWQATIGNDMLVHTRAYQYANAWPVNKKGDFVITVQLRVWPWE